MNFEARTPTVDEYGNLRKAVGWRPTDSPATERALTHALFSIVASDGGEVVGLGRVNGILKNQAFQSR